ncbi:FMN-binding negative transcriptional regulator [Pseudomonas sp. 5P_3.1_Bac2]|uniref:FMN-binding negative transcriptional regulator n=1 Tax=Pseudomonas sp. 5P_3.1_Bac2 TaxID=2971617 RepID=UPI0021CA7C62|nr:FMN-binding negative transcriptional regulator [Pseudomonas sp. 5P_3.1_Bac2]MCU1719226.1 FMN-binding negative transcriptional regulator [Pseudomonas sp. 5P_3.1_Bac2]
MYIPAAFRQEDLATLHQQMAACRLPTLVSQGDNGLLATPLPMLLVPDEGPYGTLYGHFAKANPQWRDLAAGAQALVLFQGPEAYVTPSWYAAKAEHGKVVPTWNYINIQARGPVQIFADSERLLKVVSALTERHEGQREQPWAVSDAPDDYIAGMLRAIVGFALPIERLDGKYKLGQNRSGEDQHGVQAGLQASGDSRDQAMAAQMRVSAE